jgi:hypothetical protein
LLHNPYVLAAIAVFGAIVMAVVVVMAAGGGSGGNGGVPAAVATENPLTPQASGVVVETIAAATVREGPGEGGELGSIPRGQKVTVTGRDADAKWFQIVFPQNSTLRGWLPASALKVGNLNIDGIALASVTPITRATVAIPTQPVIIATERPTSTPEVTATSETGPDVAITISCTPGSAVSVTVRNVGTSAVQQAATIAVQVDDGETSTSQVQLNLQPNSSVTVPTAQDVTSGTTMVVLTLAGDIDTDDNAASCTVQGSGPTATPKTSTPVVTNTPSQTSATPALTATPVVTTVSP